MPATDIGILRAAASEAPLFAIIDVASAPGALRRLPAKGRQNWCLFEGVGIEDAQAVAPWLVPIPAHDDQMLEATWQLAVDAPCLTWLASALPTQQLASRLCHRTEACLPGGDEVVLRYYDPRILNELDAGLAGDLRQRFFCLGKTWLYLDRDRQWHHIDLTPPGRDDPLAHPMALPPDTENILIQASEAGQALATAQAQAMDVMAALRPAAAFDLAKRCGRELAAAGIDSHAARVMLLLLAAPSAGRLLDTPHWSSAQARLKARTLDLDAMAAELAQVATDGST